jgi:hypothetical protein
VINEAEPASCSSCGKAFGTKQMVESMLSKLSAFDVFRRWFKALKNVCGLPRDRLDSKPSRRHYPRLFATEQRGGERIDPQ